MLLSIAAIAGVVGGVISGWSGARWRIVAAVLAIRPLREWQD